MNTFNTDLHCDLLAYLLRANTSVDDGQPGCSLPYLKKGHVKLQVMAIYASTGSGSFHNGIRQSEIFREFLNSNDFFLFYEHNINIPEYADKVGVISAIENASAFCEEDMDLDAGFKNLETIIQNTRKIFYMGITHHTENRFGGGNFTDTGLKEDGKVLIDYISDRKIAIDLAHTSDQLAYDILNYLDRKNYSVPILASHSNYRSVYDNKRNLPDELVQELIRRKGLIGLNFIKDYIDHGHPERLYEHIQYALSLGAENCIAYGGDFFYDKEHPDQSRIPFFFDEFKDATAYNTINKKISEDFSPGNHGKDKPSECPGFSSQERYLIFQSSCILDLPLDDFNNIYMLHLGFYPSMDINVQ
ncbi:membrane dipeptidase [Chryseobacterium camelliae]|uniref:Membrane dipeptidase n=2 Tax=Chryseobacterium camelliae TaxID=1265445 RepID=A0ABU0TGL1_9FLAO|nr:membrane dipeptidase [Chryseobacterium camelliae]